MTRFKNALLDELVAYTQRPAPAGRPARSRSTQIIRIGGLASAGAAALVTALLIAPSGQQAAYAVDKNPNGTVTITFRELGHAAEATRDLRKVGVRAQVVQIAAPGSCATTREGEPLAHMPLPPYSALPRLPNSYPIHDDRRWLQDFSGMRLTINPAGIPADAVAFIAETPSKGLIAGLVYAPAPTCWEWNGRSAGPDPRSS